MISPNLPDEVGDVLNVVGVRELVDGLEPLKAVAGGEELLDVGGLGEGVA